MSSYMYNVHFSHYSKHAIYSISQSCRLERVLMQYFSGSASQEKLGLETVSWATGWTALLYSKKQVPYNVCECSWEPVLYEEAAPRVKSPGMEVCLSASLSSCVPGGERVDSSSRPPATSCLASSY